MRLLLVGLLLAAFSCLSAFLSHPAFAKEGCALVDGVFQCPGTTPRETMAALAAPATGEALRTALPAGLDFPDRRAREAFRRSVEDVRSRARRHARRVARNRRRGRTDDATYAAMRAQWDRALVHYRMAMALYDKSVWNDPRPRH